MKSPGVILIVLTFSLISNIKAQSHYSPPPDRTLYDTIKYMDSIFFEAFNTCDTITTKSLFTEDLEFFHDRGGLTNYQQNLQSIRYRCSSQVKVRRELVKGSLEVYPIANYGAIQVGEHKFYYSEPGKAEQLDGTFKFTHIWTNRNNRWQISRVISYNH